MNIQKQTNQQGSKQTNTCLVLPEPAAGAPTAWGAPLRVIAVGLFGLLAWLFACFNVLFAFAVVDARLCRLDIAWWLVIGLMLEGTLAAFEWS